jgi:hypothetical protein
MGSDIQELGPFVAGKAFRTGGKEYKSGDPVDTSLFENHKIEQLLRQRLLKPAPPAASK